MRGLAYIGALLYGSRLSWKDPVKFVYAFGTKSGKPYYVNRKAMIEAAEFLKSAVLGSKMGDGDKVTALRRLKSFIENLEKEESVNH